MNSRKLTDIQLAMAARSAGIEPAALKAFSIVESAGEGFLPDGRPKILFEGHIFYKQLVIAGITPSKYLKGNGDILYEVWDKTKYKGGTGEYDRLQKAIEIHKTAALKSASWGMFQIMGFNHGLCDYPTVHEFVTAMYVSEEEHLKAAIKLLESMKIKEYLNQKNWKMVAAKYNGPQYSANLYDIRLQKAYMQYIHLNNI